jgi:GNAT superfamily N-acetyltransferase
MSTTYRLVVEDQPDPADLSLIGDNLREYNREQVGASGFQRLAVFLRDESGAIAGGLVGGTYWGWLHVDLLWVREDLRHLRQGSALLQAAEQAAIERGCCGSHLDTFSFQALGFYLKHGYTVFGELEGIPPGHSQYFLRKTLARGESEMPLAERFAQVLE